MSNLHFQIYLFTPCGSFFFDALKLAEQASRIKQQKKSQVKSLEFIPGIHLIDSLLDSTSKSMTAAQI